MLSVSQKGSNLTIKGNKKDLMNFSTYLQQAIRDGHATASLLKNAKAVGAIYIEVTGKE